jgi:hypothetical protein
MDKVMVVEIGIITLIIFVSVLVWAWIDDKKTQRILNQKEI